MTHFRSLGVRPCAQGFGGHCNSTGRRNRIGRGARLRTHDYHAHLAAWAVANLASVGCARDIAGSAVAVTLPASGPLVTHLGRRARAPERYAMPNRSFKPNPLRGAPVSDAPGLSLGLVATTCGSAVFQRAMTTVAWGQKGVGR